MAFNTFELNLYKHDCLGAKDIKIAYVGDNHDDIDAHQDSHLRDLKAYCKRYPAHTVLFLLMGDYGDFCSTSERSIIRNSKLHETTLKTLDDVAENRLVKRIKQFEFMKGRVIGVHNGNHDWKFQSGRFNGMYASGVLAQELQSKHLGYVAYSKVMFTNFMQKTSNYSTTIDIVSCHGRGGGRLIGAGFNQVEQMTAIFPAADIYAQGHNHQLGGLPSARLEVEYDKRNSKLILKQKVISFIRTGSSMQGYRVGESSYVSDNLMKPCALGFPVSVIEFGRIQRDGERTYTRKIQTLA